MKETRSFINPPSHLRRDPSLTVGLPLSPAPRGERAADGFCFGTRAGCCNFDKNSGATFKANSKP